MANVTRSACGRRAAWVDGKWRTQVLLTAGSDGCWTSVVPDSGNASEDATRSAGPVLPGMVNAHSHAFQRAFAGLAEHRGEGDDDFWSWRERMYAIANGIEPDALRALAIKLYREMLHGGYTHVCEFHYLQHAPDGSRYADPLAMSRALCRSGGGDRDRAHDAAGALRARRLRRGGLARQPAPFQDRCRGCPALRNATGAPPTSRSSTPASPSIRCAPLRRRPSPR